MQGIVAFIREYKYIIVPFLVWFGIQLFKFLYDIVKEKKALELVKEEWKKEWGNLDDVSFNNESIRSDGKYIVSVNDSRTTRVIRRYVVDTITGVVEGQ